MSHEVSGGRTAQRCDCNWGEELTPEKPCGCGDHDARLYRDEVYHYDGKHWIAACLINALASSSSVPPAQEIVGRCSHCDHQATIHEREQKCAFCGEWEWIIAHVAALPPAAGIPVERWFSIQTERGAAAHPLRVPWSVAEKAYAVYAAQYGKRQSLEDLDARGGFGPSEMDTLFPGWRDEASEITRLRALLAKVKP